MNDRNPIGLDDGWDIMQKGITKLKKILDGHSAPHFSADDYIMLYTTVYNLCIQKPPHDYNQQLYDRYHKSVKEYIQSTILPSLEEKHDEFLLREFVKRWGNHKVMIRWLSHLFHYLERYFISRKNLPLLKEVGLAHFRDLVYDELKIKLRDAAISLIDQEREGRIIDRALLKNVLDIFVEMGMGEMVNYANDFEAFMLNDTSAYYARKASTWIVTDSCPDYMFKAEECLKAENERVYHYLHSSSETKLLEKVQYELLSVYGTQLLEKENSGCYALLRDEKIDDLSRMFKLFSQIPLGLHSVSNMFKQYVTAEGKTLVKMAEDAESNNKAEKRNTVCLQKQGFIRNVIELHDKYLALVDKCFVNHTLFHKALKEAFEVFCNKGISGSSGAELLATFCDNILKEGANERLSDEAIEDTLEKVVKLLDYISDKDLFAQYCRKNLARRLLFHKSVNYEHERNILTKLKQQFGCQLTSNMEIMVKDLTLSKEKQSCFEENLRTNSKENPEIDLSVTVLTAGMWPNFKSFDIKLPEEMGKCAKAFKGFYETEHNGRKLKWVCSLGTCNIIGKFDAQTVELIVSTYQACVLQLFNSSERLTYDQITTKLNLNMSVVTHADVATILHSLSCEKYKILIKEPNTQTISPTDSFEFNSKFTSKMRRIEITLPPIEDNKKITEEVDEDRRDAIDAAIIRIMKNRKVLGHQELTVECVNHLRHMFKPDIKLIKRRIEELLTRDYLERDRTNHRVFRYLA